MRNNSAPAGLCHRCGANPRVHNLRCCYRCAIPIIAGTAVPGAWDENREPVGAQLAFDLGTTA